MNFTIVPLFLGRFKAFEKSIFTYRTGAGEHIEPPLFAYLVTGGDHRILVDTGPADPSIAQQKTHRKVHDAKTLSSALEEQGSSPRDITRIILTHLHWDHAYNLELFPNAPILVQKKELQYAVTPLPCDIIAYGYDEKNGPPCWMEGFHRMQVIDGKYAPAPGLTVIPLPGHTPGFQAVQVTTKEGRYLIASDLFPLYENYEQCIPSGIHVDLNDWYASHAKTAKICEFILPGHDQKVLERDVYGG